jgi:glutamate dehydrogenase (NAD(P)+)
VVIIPDILINTGGVIVSYFEWLKNIEHVSPGKLTKKYEEKTKLKLLKTLNITISESNPLYRNLEGAKEIDIVNSGLEEIMTS